MRKAILILISICTLSTINAQESIDGSIDFQTDPNKKYSLYIPSTYDEMTPNPAFVAFHPLNTRRWNGASWRDTLITFAETNGLILISPDGGTDGRIDDPIDTAFTTFLIDSVMRAYNIDPDAIYAIGFSWGGRTTYTYGLSRPALFAGYMPIGAAITGLNEVGTLVENGNQQNVFIIHGQSDSPGSRYYPIRDALIENEACVNDTLMPGVGHTIDFIGRNNLLNQGYEYLRDNRCLSTTNEDLEALQSWNMTNPLEAGVAMEIPKHVRITYIMDINGKEFQFDDPVVFKTPGIYLIHYKTTKGGVGIAKLIVGK